MSKNYNRKGTIEPQMQKWFVTVLMVCAGASSAFAQSKPAPGDAGGGAYYEFMMGMQLELKGDGEDGSLGSRTRIATAQDFINLRVFENRQVVVDRLFSVVIEP